MTALIVGVKGGYTEVVKELLKRNPNVNMTDKDGNTALAIAAKEGHTEIVQDLLDAGTYVNVPDRVRPSHSSLTSFLCRRVFEIHTEVQFTSCLIFFSVALSEWGDNADWSGERRSCGDSPSSAEQIRRY